MNRRLKIASLVLGVLLGLLVLLTLGGYLLPSDVQWVDTSAILDAPSADLFPFFNSRAGQQRLWTQAAGRFGTPPMEIADLGGPDQGVGAKLGFFPGGGNRGGIAGLVSSIARGRGVITESEPDLRVVYDIDFGMVEARRTIVFETFGDTTMVSWSETLLATNPLMRYALLLGGPSINEDFDQVLVALGEVAGEGGSATP